MLEGEKSKTSGPFSATALKRRLLRGFGATALGPITTAIVQLGTVPLLLQAWGAAKYGDWLLLSAVPSCLSLTNLGFGDASGSDMTMRVAAGDRKGAVETFQSSWALLLLISTAILLLVSATVWSIPWQHWMRLSTVSHKEASWIILVFAAYVIVGQQTGILESGYRCDGHFASGIFWINIMRLSEASFGSVVGVFTGSLYYSALTYFAVRGIGTTAFGVLLYRQSPWIRLGLAHARLSRIRQLAMPALGFVALPLAFSLSIQGYIVLIGAVLGSVAVVSFSTLRTLSRLTFQVLGALAQALWPEMSSAFGAGQIAVARRLHRRACQIAFAASTSCVIILWLLGPTAYRLWTRGALQFDAPCFHILLTATLASTFWYVSSVVPMSTNSHRVIAILYAATAGSSLLLAFPLLELFGISGAGISLVLVDLVMCVVVLRTAMRQLGDTPRDFLHDTFLTLRMSAVSRLPAER